MRSLRDLVQRRRISEVRGKEGQSLAAARVWGDVESSPRRLMPRTVLPP
jgi:hypothetical protein